MTQSPSNPISAGQKVTYTYTLTDNAWPGTRFSGATNNSKGGLILTDSACPASNMQIVSGIAYYHPGYGTLLSGGTAVLQCTTTYPTAQKVTHQLTVQPGVLNFDAPVAQLPVSSVSGTYPSALNPYQTVVNPPTINTGDFQLGQRVETNPVNTGSGSNAFKPVTGVKYSYSALAYNPQNRLLYALTNSDSNIRSGQVITIDANGTIRRTGVYLPYPVWNVTASTGDQNTAKRDLKQLQGGVAPYSASGHATGGFNAGFFDDSGNYYVAQASTTGTGNLYKIDPLTALFRRFWPAA